MGGEGEDEEEEEEEEEAEEEEEEEEEEETDMLWGEEGYIHLFQLKLQMVRVGIIFVSILFSLQLLNFDLTRLIAFLIDIICKELCHKIIT